MDSSSLSKACWIAKEAALYITDRLFKGWCPQTGPDEKWNVKDGGIPHILVKHNSTPGKAQPKLCMDFNDDDACEALALHFIGKVVANPATATKKASKGIASVPIGSVTIEKVAFALAVAEDPALTD
eukprot:1865504-Alexandrium_andersonii.AAC.1